MTNRERIRSAGWLVVLGVLALGAAHAAEGQRAARDPTVPPIVLQAPPGVGTGVSVAAPAPAAPAASASAAAAAQRPVSAAVAHHILIVDGTPYVVDAGRRRGVGEMLGAARIERIEDSAVWVRDGGALKRLPMFGPAVRRAANSRDAEPATRATAADAGPSIGGGRNPNRTLLPGEPS